MLDQRNKCLFSRNHRAGKQVSRVHISISLLAKLSLSSEQMVSFFEMHIFLFSRVKKERTAGAGEREREKEVRAGPAGAGIYP